jgi:predicted nucleotidyltransferase
MKKNKTTVRKNGQLFGKMDILKYFFEEPEREFHLREIARVNRLAASTASKYLSTLIKNKIITSRRSKGFSIFKSNTSNAIYKDFKLLYNIYQIRSSGLIDFLAEEFNQPSAIILFGSFRKSENIPGSDIDIFIETAGKKELELSKFEKKLGHPIQLFQFSRKEVEQMKSKNKELLNNIVNGIVLEGFFEVFK